MKKIDLNTLQPENDGNWPDLKATDNSKELTDVDCELIFRNHQDKLISHIGKHNCVLGCIAWLTDFKVLDALAKVGCVSIVVQKEDFLRPDLEAQTDWKTKLQKSYSRLRNTSHRFHWPGMFGQLSTCWDSQIDPIRCVGNHNRDRTPAFPRMHNKFLIFGNIQESENKDPVFEFTSVWTGSYNITYNASNSLENAILLNDKRAAWAFYDEYCQIFALSEDLNWTNDWCEPEFRIGT